LPIYTTWSTESCKERISFVQLRRVDRTRQLPSSARERQNAVDENFFRAYVYIYIYIYTHTHTWRSPRETRETSGLDISFGISSPLVSRVWFFRMKSCTTEAAFARQRSNGRDGFLRLANESRCMRVFATIKTINQIVETQERKQNSQIRWKTQKIKKNSKIKGKKWRVALIGDWGEKRKKKKKNGGK